MSRSTPTKHVAVGITKRPLHLSAGPSGYEFDVPKGTRCIMLDGGSMPWVVDDLSFIPQDSHRSLGYHDADHYGIHVPAHEIVDVRPA